jgi:hypothetical protein
MLRQPKGATLQAIVEAAGRQKQSVRGFLSAGARKKALPAGIAAIGFRQTVGNGEALGVLNVSRRHSGLVGAIGESQWGEKMRIPYIATTLMVVVAGAGGIRANVVGAGSTGIAPFAADPAIPGDMALGPNGIGRALNPEGAPGGVGNPAGLAKPRGNAIRLAQAVDPVSTGDSRLAPFKWVGVLETPTATQPQPNLAPYCTGQFITEKVVLTAGHCLKDLDSNPVGPWYDLTKAIFILQYQNGEGSQTFKVKCGAANPLWRYPSNYKSLPQRQQQIAFWTGAQHDFAMILVDVTNGTSPTGYMPVALDWKGKYTYAFRVGYPDDILGGEFIQQMGGPVFFANAIQADFADYPNLVVQWGPVTDFTWGSSGGAWVANADPTGKTYSPILIAVSSANKYDLAGGYFAAYLTAAEFNPLLTFVSNGCK